MSVTPLEELAEEACRSLVDNGPAFLSGLERASIECFIDAYGGRPGHHWQKADAANTALAELIEAENRLRYLIRSMAQESVGQ